MTHEQLEHAIKDAIQIYAGRINAGNPDATDISSLAEVTESVPLVNLDYWERLIRWTIASEMGSTQSPFWHTWKKPAVFLTWLDISSENGFTREKLLRSVSGGAPNRFFFALALRRLNDWVPQVRQAARENLYRIARMSRTEDISDAVFVTLKYCPSWGRMDEDDRKVLVDIMSTPEVTALLRQRLISATSGPMALILAQMGRTNLVDNFLENIAASAVQPTLRAKAYKSLLAGEMTWIAGRKWQWTNKAYGERKLIPVIQKRQLDVTSSFQDLLTSAARDRSSIVRKIAGEMLIREPEKAGASYIPLAKALAADVSPSVSEQGEFMLRRLIEGTGV